MSALATPAETEIRNLIGAWEKAVRDKDIGKVIAHHADDLVMFDVPPPVVVRGLDAYRATWPQFFRWQSEVDGLFEIASLEVTAGDDVAFAVALVRCAPKAELETDNTPRLRLTFGLRKERGAWAIAHEHHSFPASSE